MRPRHWLRWLLLAIAGLVVLAAAGPFIYHQGLHPARQPDMHGTTRAVMFTLTGLLEFLLVFSKA